MAEITPQLVDKLLYNLPALKEQIEAIQPRGSGSVIVVMMGGGKKRSGSPVEKVAIKRATLSVVVDAVERAIRHLPRDPDKKYQAVYRLKYRVGMSNNQAGKRLYMHRDTIRERVDFIRDAVTQYLRALPGFVLDEFFRQLSA